MRAGSLLSAASIALAMTGTSAAPPALQHVVSTTRQSRRKPRISVAATKQSKEIRDWNLEVEHKKGDKRAAKAARTSYL